MASGLKWQHDDLGLSRQEFCLGTPKLLRFQACADRLRAWPDPIHVDKVWDVRVGAALWIFESPPEGADWTLRTFARLGRDVHALPRRGQTTGLNRWIIAWTVLAVLVGFARASGLSAPWTLRSASAWCTDLVLRRGAVAL